MTSVVQPAEVEVKVCLNCKEVAKLRFLCLDCWRMAVVTAALIGGGTETLHRFLWPLVEGFVGK